MDEGFLHGRVAATTRDRETYWKHWLRYVSPLGIDPYLQGADTSIACDASQDLQVELERELLVEENKSRLALSVVHSRPLAQ